MRFIKIAHLVSLDVVLGTMAFQAFLHEIFLNDMPSFSEQLSLACAVWGIYLVDRIIDRKKGMVQDERHIFQSQHAIAMKIILVLLGLMGGVSTLFLDQHLIYFGFGLGAMMLIYWILWFYGFFNHLSSSKEILTALIYTMGVGASSWYRISWSVWTVLLAVMLFLLVFQNLGMYSLWEWEEVGQLKSIQSWKRILLGVEGIFLVLFVGMLFYFDEKIAFMPFAITFAIQCWIHYFSKNKLASRTWGELAYCSPFLYFAYEFFSK
ncbi:hypothetical protein [Aquirufa aurantiipilula]|uniref:hypothetical protein n=1 Tax=Aquirufa aurantiipilula TaxID=2696561 RepID=UPI001CAA6FD3|nr:hypothetical protein [Aquirufa aurantiipilula]MBZ1327156.1 hypothetical protein [Aquirufa aurantiipilula]